MEALVTADAPVDGDLLDFFWTLVFFPSANVNFSFQVDLQSCTKAHSIPDGRLTHTRLHIHDVNTVTLKIKNKTCTS